MVIMKFIFLFVLFTSLAQAQSNYERLSQIQELRRVAFGSCNNQTDVQPLWKDVLAQKPDLWIWGGDNIYADWDSVRNMEASYAKQNAHPVYKEVKSVVPIIGTWDDHDYAYNNAGGSFAHKKLSQELALNFFDEPDNSPRRAQEGIYASYVFGPVERQVKVLLLDNRYFKNLDASYPMLGKSQWDWLETELTNSRAKVHLIVAGLAILSPLIPYTEEWAETSEMNRMLKLLEKTRPKGVVFLTGDKHFSAISHRYGHLEFMSSGMTHVAPRKTWWYLRQKFANTYFGLSYGQIEMQWEESTPTITLSMRTPTGRNVNVNRYKWTEGKWKWIPKEGFAVPKLSTL